MDFHMSLVTIPSVIKGAMRGALLKEFTPYELLPWTFAIISKA